MAFWTIKSLHIVLYALLFSIGDCGRDAGGPIQLVPSEMEDEPVVMETGKSIDDGIAMQHLFQQIEEKLFKPNFDNLIRHMDRFTRAILKLDARVDSIHNQMDQLHKQTSNCSTIPQINRLQSNMALSLDDLDQKFDQIQRQLKLSTLSTVHTTIEDISQRTRDIQIKLDHSTAEKSILLSVENKQTKLSEKMDQFINTNITSQLESINTTFHGSIMADMSKLELLMEQNNDAHYKWFGNLIGMFNDGIEKIETNCVLGKRNHEPDSDVPSVSVLEHQLETIIHKLNKLERSCVGASTTCDTDKPSGNADTNWHECSLIMPLLTQLSDTLGFKFDQIIDVCHRDEGLLLANLKKINDKLHDSDLLTSLDLKTNMTQEKLNYMSSVLTLMQLDQSSIGINVNSLMKNDAQTREQIEFPSDITSEMSKISKNLDDLMPKKELLRLIEENSNNLQDLKETLMHQSPIQTEYNKVVEKVESQLFKVSDKLNSITSESVDRLAKLLEQNRRSQNDTLFNDLEIATKIDIIYQRLSDDTSFEILNRIQSDMRIMSTQLHPLMELPTQLYNFTLSTHMSPKSSVTSDIDSYFWSRTSRVLDSMAELQKRMEDKFSKLKSSLQSTVDDGMVEIVDILGQNKNWLQQTATSFVSQHSDNLIKMKDTMSSVVSKGFDNLHFMYQYLNGKLDQIHLIASHNMEDCADVYKSGQTTSGVYTIYPRKSKEMRVYCDMDTEGGGWTLIQRRDDRQLHPRISFNQTWLEYKYGFGNLEYEFWLGNENIHMLTHQNNYVLRIDMSYAEPQPQMPQYKRKFWHNLGNDTKSLYAQYSHFRIRTEHLNYSLLYDKYMGIHPYDGLEGRAHSVFTTWDHAADINLAHCAKIQGGGWWYGNECFRYALNSKPKKYYWEDGSLFTGITWGGTADFALLNLVEMKIIPMSVYQSSLMRKG